MPSTADTATARFWLARAGLALAVTVGTLFAYAQWSRGAHFFSHDLWSAAICWGATLLLYRWAFRGRPWPRQPPSI